MIESFIGWVANHLPYINEYFVTPCLGILYSKVWNHIEYRFSNYKTRRYQNALVKES
mgnify:CR=1|jgi:hypothetical protein